MEQSARFHLEGRYSLQAMPSEALHPDGRAFTLADFDFELPPELIAQHPAAQRSASRLLDGRGHTPVDRVFRELPALLQPGDLLVFNDTRVLKARLFGEKPTGGAVEALVERVLPGAEPHQGEVLAHLRASKSPKPGQGVIFRSDAGESFRAEVLGREPWLPRRDQAYLGVLILATPLLVLLTPWLKRSGLPRRRPQPARPAGLHPRRPGDRAGGVAGGLSV